jgi:hypothetical protein
MILHKTHLAIAIALALALATASGCGGAGGQDVGTPASDAPTSGVQSRTFNARAIDGYLAGATAYVDLNGNGKLDAFEPRAVTRDDGALVTPHTSMQVSTNAQKLTTSGAPAEIDYIGALSSGESVRAQLATYLARMSAVVAARASSLSFDTSDAEAWDAGYLAMAHQLEVAQAAGDASDMLMVFASTDSLRDLVRHVGWARLHPAESMPADYTLPDETAMTPMLDFSGRLVVLGRELAAAMQAATITNDELTASLRALAFAAERGLADPTDAELDDVFSWIRNQISTPGALGPDLLGLAADDVDLNVLIDRQFDFIPTSNAMSVSAVIPESAATAFAAVANTVLKGSVRREAEQGDALVFVSGESGARSGPLHLCIRYRDGSGDFDTSSTGDPDGALLVDGRWNLLDDHTLTMNVDVVGGVRPLIVKSVGVSANELQYRFDYGGDLTEWGGAAPASVSAGVVPKDQAACRAALIEAFGAAAR